MEGGSRPRHYRHTRLMYVASASIPSGWANSIQVVHMVQALAPHFQNVDLSIPWRTRAVLRSLVGDVFAPYGYVRPRNLVLRWFRRGSRELAAAVGIPNMNLARFLIYTRQIDVAHEVAKRSGNVIYESHDVGRDSRYTDLGGFVRSMNVCRGARIVCTLADIQRFFVAHGIRPEKTAVLANAVSGKFFGAHSRGHLHKMTNGLSRTRKKIVYIGSLQEEKGASFLVEAAREIRGFDFFVIGGKKNESEALRSIAAGIENIFIRHHIDHRDVPSVLAESDYLIMPYRKVGKWIDCMCPLKMFEFAAAGKVIIASDLPIFEGVLRYGENCLTYEPESFNSLERALARAERLTEEERTRLVEQARQLALSATWEERANRVLNWYYEQSEGSDV